MIPWFPESLGVRWLIRRHICLPVSPGRESLWLTQWGLAGGGLGWPGKGPLGCSSCPSAEDLCACAWTRWWGKHMEEQHQSGKPLSTLFSPWGGSSIPKPRFIPVGAGGDTWMIYGSMKRQGLWSSEFINPRAPKFWLAQKTCGSTTYINTWSTTLKIKNHAYTFVSIPISVYV